MGEKLDWENAVKVCVTISVAQVLLLALLKDHYWLCLGMIWNDRNWSCKASTLPVILQLPKIKMSFWKCTFVIQQRSKNYINGKERNKNSMTIIIQKLTFAKVISSVMTSRVILMSVTAKKIHKMQHIVI